MPVKTAEEDGVQHARRREIRIALQDLVELVWILPSDMSQRDGCHA
jgi:hypothetical protein